MILIVWPKVHRVLSGEKVVMSNYLGAGRDSSSESITGESRTNVGQSELLFDKNENSGVPDQDASKEVKEACTFKPNSRIPLKKDDAMPSSVASKIVGSESLLRMITDKL
jgi:hypothetical protein